MSVDRSRFALTAGLLALLAACASGGTEQPGDATGPSSAAQVAAPSAVVSAAPSASASAIAPALAPPDVLSGAAIMRDVEWLTSPELKGRGSSTPDEARAGERLASELDQAEVGKLDGARIVPFSFKERHRHAWFDRKSANVVGLIEPPDNTRKEYLVLGAHYDHLGQIAGKTYYGAEDNASGTAVVLAVARGLQARRSELGRPVVIAFFGAEESGLNGSKEFVSSWAFDKHPISAMVNVDMIGRSLVDQPKLWIAARFMGILSDVDADKAVAALLPVPEPKGFGDTIREACKKHDLRLVTIADLPASVRARAADMARGRSDHAPFEAKKIPFVFFSSGESDDYHLPSDTADKLEPAILEQRARGVLDTVIALSK